MCKKKSHNTMCIIIYLISLLNSLMSVGYIRCNILICLFDLYSTGRGAPILVHDWYLCVRLSVWVLKYCFWVYTANAIIGKHQNFVIKPSKFLLYFNHPPWGSCALWVLLLLLVFLLPLILLSLLLILSCKAS